MNLAAERLTAEQIVFNAIEQAARNERRCPSNTVLANLIGAKSPTTAVRVLAKLTACGKIVVHSGHCSRVVDIPELGIGTAGPLPQKHWREVRGQTLSTNIHSERPVERAAIQRPLRAPPTPKLEQRLSVSRDPCPRCGARGDVDCGHPRPASGRLTCL